MFVPSRLLFGILPSALLDHYMFWQDEDDNLRGYPREDEPDSDNQRYLIMVTLRRSKKVSGLFL